MSAIEEAWDRAADDVVREMRSAAAADVEKLESSKTVHVRVGKMSVQVGNVRVTVQSNPPGQKVRMLAVDCEVLSLGGSTILSAVVPTTGKSQLEDMTDDFREKIGFLRVNGPRITREAMPRLLTQAFRGLMSAGVPSSEIQSALDAAVVRDVIEG